MPRLCCLPRSRYSNILFEFLSKFIYIRPFRSTISVCFVAMAWFETVRRTENTVLGMMGDKRAQIKSRQTKNKQLL